MLHDFSFLGGQISKNFPVTVTLKRGGTSRKNPGIFYFLRNLLNFLRLASVTSLGDAGFCGAVGF